MMKSAIELAERRVLDGEHRILRQRRVIGEMKTRGETTRHAEKQLHALYAMQEQHVIWLELLRRDGEPFVLQQIA